MLKSAILFSAFLLPVIIVTYGFKCAHFYEEDCGGNSTCTFLNWTGINDALLCCHFNSSITLKNLARPNENTTALHFRNLNFNESLDIEFLNLHNVSSVKSIAITDSNITKIMSQLKFEPACVNLSNNGLMSLDQGIVKNFNTLQYLDLSNNSLTVLPDLNATNITLNINILGNINMSCQSVKNVSNNFSVNFERKEDACCQTRKTIGWFNSTIKMSLVQLEIEEKLETLCPDKCHCEIFRMSFVKGKIPTYTTQVDCFGLGLTKLPEFLPNNTVSLNVSNNHISDLEPFVKNLQYGEITEFFADDNEISSILSLEGSRFMQSFIKFSIKRNKLKTIPTYIFSNAFDRNQMAGASMGGNKLQCDCNTAKIVKVWLMTNTKYINDYREVTCENLPVKVIDLDTNQICAQQPEWTDYINYIVAGEVALLLILIMKVSYDYWIFKTAGHLPWPANKMPKLPCDWVFET